MWVGEYQKGSEDLGEDETVFNDGDATDRAPKRPLNVFFYLFSFASYRRRTRVEKDYVRTRVKRKNIRGTENTRLEWEIRAKGGLFLDKMWLEIEVDDEFWGYWERGWFKNFMSHKLGRPWRSVIL